MTSSKLRVVLVTCALVGLAGWVGYLQHQFNAAVAQGFDAGTQHYELMLTRARTLETLLEQERPDDALVEVRRIREATLTGLVVIAGNTNVDSLVRRYALRVFCAEMPVELLPPRRNSTDAINVRMIQGTQPLCQQPPG